MRIRVTTYLDDPFIDYISRQKSLEHGVSKLRSGHEQRPGNIGIFVHKQLYKKLSEYSRSFTITQIRTFSCESVCIS